MQWLSSWPAIACFITAAIAEVGAYYIPFVDNLLDTIATPLSVGAGTLLATSILPIGNQEPLVRWGIGLLAGGSMAGTIQMGTGLLRLFSSKATLGTGNAVVATSENAAAVSITALSFFIPVIIAVLLIALIVWIIVKLTKRFSNKPIRN
jgi:glucan phosphoethanolaminetransferase (alkaline phosphatase superfamily)